MPPKPIRFKELSDEELMVQYVRGEETAFEILLGRYQRPLYGFLYRLLGRLDRAEDVFQEVFYEIVRARERYRPDARFAAWIFRIARNRAVDRMRRDGFRDMESLDVGINPHDRQGESKVNMVADAGPSPEELTAGIQVEAALEKALAGLPDEQREVFLLKEKSGLTLTEIADITHVSPNTVKSRLRYGLEKIRASLISQGIRP